MRAPKSISSQWWFHRAGPFLWNVVYNLCDCSSRLSRGCYCQLCRWLGCSTQRMRVQKGDGNNDSGKVLAIKSWAILGDEKTDAVRRSRRKNTLKMETGWHAVVSKPVDDDCPQTQFQKTLGMSPQRVAGRQGSFPRLGYGLAEIMRSTSTLPSSLWDTVVSIGSI